MDAKKLEELFEDSSAVEEVFSGDKDQVLAKLAARGIEMTEAELAEFSFGITNGAKGSDDELSMDELESVAGGAKKKKAKVNIGFFNGLFDACDDRIFGTTKGSNKSGPLYALGYSIGYGVSKLAV